MFNIINEIYYTYVNKKMFAMLCLGISCGIPIALFGSTLVIWLKQSKIDYTTIGLFGMLTLPYALKFLWAPFIDNISIPFLTKKLGKRKSWLIISQIILTLTIFSVSYINPFNHLFYFFTILIVGAVAAATQSIIILAYQVEFLNRNKYGVGEAMCVLGARLGILMSGAGALYLSEFFNWEFVYKVMAMLSMVGIFTTLLIKEPAKANINEPQINVKNLIQAKFAKFPNIINILLSWIYVKFFTPFKDFIANKGWKVAILLMLFYRTNDNLILHMINVFFLDMGFSKIEIANVIKIFGMISMVIGGLVGGIFVKNYGIKKCLTINALLHGLSFIGFLAIFYIGNNIKLLYLVICLENFTVGMLITGFFALQMSLVKTKIAATQLSLLTSVTLLGKTFTSSISGWFISLLGWQYFFILGICSTLISLILVYILKNTKTTFNIS